jgi:hypothetical protein
LQFSRYKITHKTPIMFNCNTSPRQVQRNDTSNMKKRGQQLFYVFL